MDEKEKVVDNILRVFSEKGLLENVMIVGSWCQHYYREYYNDNANIPAVSTMDMDILIPQPFKFKKKCNVPEILKSFGFLPRFDRTTGLVKYDKAEFTIEFLTSPARNSSNNVREIESIHTNAQELNYLNLYHSYKLNVTYKGLLLLVPEPQAYILHKTIINDRRSNPDKKEKDANAVREMTRFILADEDRKKRLFTIFNELPAKWRKKIKENSESISKELFAALTSTEREMNQLDKLILTINREGGHPFYIPDKVAESMKRDIKEGKKSFKEISAYIASLNIT